MEKRWYVCVQLRFAGVASIGLVQSFPHNLKICQFYASLPPPSIDSVFIQIKTRKYSVIPWEPLLMHVILLALYIADVSSYHPN
jgi:hypothetical protein